MVRCSKKCCEIFKESIENCNKKCCKVIRKSRSKSLGSHKVFDEDFVINVMKLEKLRKIIFGKNKDD